MKVIHIAAEITPIIKVGGLGEVVGGLSQALAKENIDVEVIIPKYKNINTKHLKNLKLLNTNFKVFEKNKWQMNKIYYAELYKVKIILIENKKYFHKNKVYGYKNDITRFLYFCKTVLEFFTKNNYKIDILHLHDWHTSFIAPLYKEIYSKQKLKVKNIVLSIHNLKYQGLCKPKDIQSLKINGRYYLHENRLKDPIKPKTLNLLKGGIIYSDKIIPVSENYANEIQTKETSCNLYTTTQKNKKKILGIINGIDTYYWNPQKDPHIKYKFSPNFSFKKLFQIKMQNKKFLQKILNLEVKNTPIICSIGRLVPQKGPKLIKHAILRSLEKGAQFVLLGTPFDKKTHKMFNNIKKSLQKNKNLSLNFEFNEQLSHRIFAASDFIIIPSSFEPCGLTQMIAFKYGCMPIVRKTGGLADTVFDLEDKSYPKLKRNGFTFNEFSFNGVNSALDRAIDFWNEKNKKYRLIIFKNLKYDFSWKASAKKYIKEYKKLLK